MKKWFDVVASPGIYPDEVPLRRCIYILIGRYRSGVLCSARDRPACPPRRVDGSPRTSHRSERPYRILGEGLTTSRSAFSDSVYHIYHSSLKIIADSCTSLLAKGFIFISAKSKKHYSERRAKARTPPFTPQTLSLSRDIYRYIAEARKNQATSETPYFSLNGSGTSATQPTCESQDISDGNRGLP